LSFLAKAEKSEGPDVLVGAALFPKSPAGAGGFEAAFAPKSPPALA
jgi:hypothetical protein